MTNCIYPDKATVTYKFGNGETKIYTTTQTPVTVAVQTCQGMPYEMTAYRCNYDVEERNFGTGQIDFIAEYRDTPDDINSTIIGNKERFIYPPFDYPILEWYEETGFSQYCRFQDYGFAIYFNNSKGERQRGYFNLLGTGIRACRPLSDCPFPEKPINISFARADGLPINLKWELTVTDSKGNVFKDYGDEQPIYYVDCGDCGNDSVRCEDPNNYPGFTCISCSSLASQVRAIRFSLPN
ncbi:MAG: hypothetical protein KME46_32360 [Brasilonema angustatum HA4187-MV1]|jgi:hypothetical protein|nr:hypothetical protein [Brasilonema angustatum HA4187-MV1]